MTALRGPDVERYIAEPDPRRPVVLLYGQDAGLVAERGAAIAAHAVGVAPDPMQIVRLEGDDVASDPMRLAEEAHAIGLFGGRRAIRVRVGSRNLASAVEPLLKAPPIDAIVVLEAGDVRRTSPLVALCEKSSGSAVIACYADEPRDVARLLDASLRAASLAIEPEARDALLALLGGDRLATRGEIDKLVVYMGDGRRVELVDVEAVVGDASASATDEVIDSAFLGDPARLLPALARLAGEGQRPDAIFGACLQHAWTLAQGLAQLSDGEPAGVIARRLVRFFKRQASFERQLSIWRSDGMTPTLRGLGEAAQTARRRPDLAWSLADRLMLRVALSARRRK